MIDFTKVPNIHYWTQRVLPCVFDESLSYVEKVNKLEEEINKLIEDYNTFGQAVTNEINTFEGETTNQINAFVTQITNDINSFKQNITNNINSFETDIRNIVEQFETSVTNSINAMQEVVNNIPETITTQVNALTIPWLQENAPTLVPEVFVQPITPLSVKDLNQLGANTIYGTRLITSKFTNYPADIPNNSIIVVTTLFAGSTQTTKMQYLEVKYTPDTTNLIGSLRYRYEITSGTWSEWYHIDYYQMPLIRKEITSSVDDFTQSGLYYNGGESGAQWSGTIPAGLEQGKYYMQTVANSGTEIVQTLVNGGTTGNSLYTRMKYGSNWGEWQGISRRELIHENSQTVTLEVRDGYHFKNITIDTDIELNSNQDSDLYNVVSKLDTSITVACGGGYPPCPITTGHVFYSRMVPTNKFYLSLMVTIGDKLNGTGAHKFFVDTKIYKTNKLN